jgi:hypothetical protein
MAVALSMPIIFSFLLVGAHFFRGSHFILVCLSLVFPCLLLVQQRWAARAVQPALICAAFEWARTSVSIMNIRLAAGEPYLRMLLILGAMAVLNLGAVFIFYSPVMRKRYKLNGFTDLTFQICTKNK